MIALNNPFLPNIKFNEIVAPQVTASIFAKSSKQNMEIITRKLINQAMNHQKVNYYKRLPVYLHSTYLRRSELFLSALDELGLVDLFPHNVFVDLIADVLEPVISEAFLVLH